MAVPRWLADEMVGRLARYLRFVGCDTVYAHGVSDGEILDRARVESRTILTRDRLLAQRAGHALLLNSGNLLEQWRAVRAAYPQLPYDVSFARCTGCNAPLARVPVDHPAGSEEGVPWDRVARGLPLYQCTACGHYYWEGTHTADLRARLARWSEGSPE